MVGDRNNVIDQIDPERIRQKTRPQALDAVWTRTPAGEYRACRRLNRDHFDSGFACPQALSNARQGASRANAYHDDVNSTTRFFPDLNRCAFAVSAGIGLVVELLRIPGVGQRCT